MVTTLCCLNSWVNHSRLFGGVFYHLHCLGNVGKIFISQGLSLLSVFLKSL